MASFLIVCSTIPEREHLLQRSLLTWYRSAEYVAESNGDVDVIVFAEGHTPTLPLPRQNSNVNLTVYNDMPITGDKNTGYNAMIADTTMASVIIFTHPEILFPLGLVKEAIRLVYKHGQDKTVHFKGYRLSREFTERINIYPWHTPEVIERDHYDALVAASDYDRSIWSDNRNVRRRTNWPGTITYASSYDVATKLYPMPSFGWIGPDDMFFMEKKKRLGIGLHTAQHSIVFHQWHDRSANTNDIPSRQRAVKDKLKEEFGE